MFRKRSRFWIIAALTLCTALATTSWGRANEQVTEFNIPPQSLDSALLVFAEQADVQVSVSTVAITGMRTQGVVGRFTPSVALARLLTETGLQFTTVGDRTYSVLQSGSARNGKNLDRPKDSVMTLAQGETVQSSVMSATSDARPGTQRAAQGHNSGGHSQEVLEEVVVTGTHIRGQAPVGSNLILIDRQEIERAGFATVQDAIRAIPQNFGGGVSEDTPRTGNNTAFSTAPNLRGLGADATLVLLNGRRLPVGAANGSITDISSIPLSAIDKVEILTDGASAIYGSDAIGGVVNIILRKEYSGAETRGRVGSVTDGGSREYQFGQTVGGEWDLSSALFSYEYYQREELLRLARTQTADSDLRPLGGSNWSSPFSNPGTVVIGAQTWAIPADQDGRSLQPADLVPASQNLANTNKGASLLPKQTRHSMFVTLQRDIGPHAKVFADAMFTKRDAEFRGSGIIGNVVVPNTNPFYVNPTGGTGPILIRYRFLDDLGPNVNKVDVETANAGLGADIRLPGEWTITAHGSYGTEDVEQLGSNIVNNAALNAALANPDPAVAFNPFGDGSFTSAATVEAIRFQTTFITESDLRYANVVASGPVMRLPAGEVRLALGGEYREPSFLTHSVPAPGTVRAIEFYRKIRAAFGEVIVPLISPDQGMPALRSLDLSVAGRYERYSDFGNATTPKFGLAWSPFEGITLRGTWSESFKAPYLPDLDESTINRSLLFPTPDPSQPSGSSTVLLVVGNNADLQEETAEAWTVGIDLDLPAFPVLDVHIGYFDIQYQNRVIRPTIGRFLTDPSLADLVDRTPTAEERAAICSRNLFIGNPADCLNAPVVAIADTRLRNAAISKASGLDFMGSYRLDTSVGSFGADLGATYLFDHQQALGSLSPRLELVSTAKNPIDFRSRGSLTWERGPLGASIFINYADGYRDTASSPVRSVSSWTTIDLGLRYAGDRQDGEWLKGTRVSLNALNVLDKDPPFLDNPEGVGYDQENAELIGRTISLMIQKEW